jgi:molybdopterin-biosynthesis enzyme MoeA-like protein
MRFAKQIGHQEPVIVNGGIGAEEQMLEAKAFRARFLKSLRFEYNKIESLKRIFTKTLIELLPKF